ncbi:hypothetical protein [Burkholderia sp. AU38729]|uniref:hypothetical protein n=1 Tax=Burkholderia sp. AU38729 TaxID=2879633 RepID=UPI001CF4F360|nr:hypothetical protein [Burkholderia sp. AU38729]MCA8061338.1 hypothetical protein [Burkholderia sp. AU38729]
MCDDRTDYNRHARGGSRTARAPERGFTLIALAIVAVALGAVMRAIAQDVRALSDLGCDRRRAPPPDMLQPLRVRLRLAPNPDAAAAAAPASAARMP